MKGSRFVRPWCWSARIWGIEPAGWGVRLKDAFGPPLEPLRSDRPSSRVRHLNYIPALEAAGFRVKVAPFLNDEYLARLYRGEPRDLRFLVQAYWGRLRQLLSAGSADLIWIEKEALP